MEDDSVQPGEGQSVFLKKLVSEVPFCWTNVPLDGLVGDETGEFLD